MNRKIFRDIKILGTSNLKCKKMYPTGNCTCTHVGMFKNVHMGLIILTRSAN